MDKYILNRVRTIIGLVAIVGLSFFVYKLWLHHHENSTKVKTRQYFALIASTNERIATTPEGKRYLNFEGTIQDRRNSKYFAERFKVKTDIYGVAYDFYSQITPIPEGLMGVHNHLTTAMRAAKEAYGSIAWGIEMGLIGNFREERGVGDKERLTWQHIGEGVALSDKYDANFDTFRDEIYEYFRMVSSLAEQEGLQEEFARPVADWWGVFVGLTTDEKGNKKLIN